MTREVSSLSRHATAPASASCPSAPSSCSQMAVTLSLPGLPCSWGTPTAARFCKHCLPQQPWPCILIGTCNDFLLLSLLSPPKLPFGSRGARLPWKPSIQKPRTCLPTFGENSSGEAQKGDACGGIKAEEWEGIILT